jgi:hypothetical protein
MIPTASQLANTQHSVTIAPAASKPVPKLVSSTLSCIKLRTRYRHPNYCESPPTCYFSDNSNYSTDPTPTKWHRPGVFFNYVPPITPTPIKSIPVIPGPFISEPGLFDNSSLVDSDESSLFNDSSDEHESVDSDVANCIERIRLEDELDTVNCSIAQLHYRISLLYKRISELQPRRDWIRRKLE